MDEQTHEQDFIEEEMEPSRPEAFYQALRNALEQLKHQPVETPPVVH